MKIIHKSEATHIDKPDGVKVDYYLRPEYEIHNDIIIGEKSQAIQPWHHHDKIFESLFILEGELVVKWKEGRITKRKKIKTGDLIEVGTSPHTFINNSGKDVKLIVIKQILSGENKRKIFKADKVVD